MGHTTLPSSPYSPPSTQRADNSKEASLEILTEFAALDYEFGAVLQVLEYDGLTLDPQLLGHLTMVDCSTGSNSQTIRLAVAY